MTKVVVAGKSDHIANDGDAQRISRGFLQSCLCSAKPNASQTRDTIDWGNPRVRSSTTSTSAWRRVPHILCLVSA